MLVQTVRLSSRSVVWRRAGVVCLIGITSCLGIDMMFDNTGGPITDAVLLHANQHARGLITSSASFARVAFA